MLAGAVGAGRCRRGIAQYLHQNRQEFGQALQRFYRTVRHTAAIARLRNWVSVFEVSASWVTGVAVVAFFAIAIEPALWLISTWYVPGYDSTGWVVFVAVVGLFVWSWSSPIDHGEGRSATFPLQHNSLPLRLLLLSFVVRLLSDWLAVSVLGALMLALDVVALALLARLHQRERWVSPLMLGALFCFALPLEVILQRSLGFLLQQASAGSACGVLSLLHSNAGCQGVRLFIDEMDVLVDLPCSGARLLILLLTGFCAMAAVRRLTPARLLQGALFCLLIAWAANTVRILLLAWGLRYGAALGIEVMLPPWHSGIGLACTGVALWLLQRWVWSVSQSRKPRPVAAGRRAKVGSALFCHHRLWRNAQRAFKGFVVRPSTAALACGCVLALWVIKPAPIDISQARTAPELPLSLAGVLGQPLPLTAVEQEYFLRYGGAAKRAAYGEHALLLVTTSSPLRHLHAPDVCFSAAGYSVQYLGVDFSSTPVAVYRARSPSGETLRIVVQFIADAQPVATSVGEVVWRWLWAPGTTWTMVQAVSPWDATPNKQESEFHAAIARAFNLA